MRGINEKNNDSKKDDNNYAKKIRKTRGIWIGIVLSLLTEKWDIYIDECPLEEWTVENKDIEELISIREKLLIMQIDSGRNRYEMEKG